MSERAYGRKIRLSPGRKLVCEILHHARKVPSLPLAFRANIRPLLEARRSSTLRPSWISLFLRAYALVAETIPELRQSYIPFPRRHIYEHPFSLGCVIVERDFRGENTVLIAKVRGPEKTSLAEIDGHLDRFRNDPVDTIPAFKHLMQWASRPWWMLRFVFWSTLNWSGATRAKRFGTFCISSLGNQGVEQVHPLSPHTTYFTFGPISEDGEVELKIIYDHRVMDGRTVGRIFQELEKTLNGQMVQEICSRPATGAA